MMNSLTCSILVICIRLHTSQSLMSAGQVCSRGSHSSAVSGSNGIKILFANSFCLMRGIWWLKQSS